MIPYQEIIDYFYPEEANARLREILLVHSRCVADKAIKVCRKHPELHADENFVFEAAMLHDIGIVRCDAPSISCFGTEPYLRHGYVGAELLKEWAEIHPMDNLESYQRVCLRHTGTGLTAKNIRENNLPLPEQDFIPETIEEKIVCYADKFFSKTRLDVEKTFSQAEQSLLKFGEERADIFRQWHDAFFC